MDIRKKTPHFLLLLLAFSCGLILPKKLGIVTVIIPKKIMSIQTSKNDPPRVAFEIINRRKTNDEGWNSIKSKPGVSLVSEFKAPIESLYARKIILPMMEFKKAQRQETTNEVNGNIEYSKNDNWMESLTPQEAQRLQEAQWRSRVLDQEWREPNFREAAGKIIEEQKRNEMLDKKSIYVAGVDDDGYLREEVDKATVEIRRHSRNTISGIIELRGLPPPTSDQWQVQISRYENGVKAEDAKFDIKTSSYSISVDDFDGSVIAQLVDAKNGDVVGEGRLRLSEYAKNRNAKITIVKTNNNFAANFPDFYRQSSLLSSTRNYQRQEQTEVHLASLDLEGKTDREGNYRFDQLNHNSWVLVRSKRDGFSEGLHLAKAGEENNLTLLPEKMVHALKNIVSEQCLLSEIAPTGSVVWGQISQGSRPASGVAVHIEGYPEYKPIYFNKFMIPDAHQDATSDNGYFAFLDLPSGFHTVVTSMAGMNLSHQNVVVDDNTISIVHVENFLDFSDVGLRVYDAFTGQAEAGVVDLQSLPSSLEVAGYAKVKLPNTNRLSLAQVNPLDEKYYASLFLYNDKDDNINTPLVRKDWLTALVNQKRINLIPEKGMIVGFVKSLNYKVFLGHEPEFSKENIIYFDAKGAVVEAGVPDGGFIVVNVPLGVQSIIISDEKSDMLYSQVAPIDLNNLVTLFY